MIFKNIFVYPKYPENLQHLYDLAANLWCTWDYEAVGLFYRIDTRFFREVNHNPTKFLQFLSKKKLQELSDDKGFLFELERVWDKFQSYLKYASVLKQEYTEEYDLLASDVIAYFSMEFGLHESIGIYAGGLGVLSGDFLKGASDLDLPIVGVGLLYKYGYFTQHIDMNGYQREIFAKSENSLIPIRELYDVKGNIAYVKVRILDEDVKVKLWKIDIGKIKLILLDTNLADNPAHLRDITSELYTSDKEKRLQQELVLGIGGIKALNTLGINTKIYHFNEGHSAFAIIGRLRELMCDGVFSFSEAMAIIRASTVFTTHTPVIAGNENFYTDLVKRYFQEILEEIGLDFDEIARLGFVDNNKDIFWLPAFAMKFSKHINGVSKQHAEISKKIWAGIFPERPVIEIPIEHITNGVHTSWISPPFTDLFDRYLGPDYIHYSRGKNNIWEKIYNIADEQLWEEHRRNKKDMINFIRRQFAKQIIAGAYSRARILNVKTLLNRDYLTIVFARRFAGYKRPTLILKDKQRLFKILTNPSKPVQIIFSGKAHPADEHSKQMIKEIIDFAAEYQVQDKVIFLEDYDINIARHLYWGADVWLNTPAVKMEASGTSGMKATMNGVLHASTLEGWWCEGFDGTNGWAITAGREYENPELQESADANQLYNLLENEITELYYGRDDGDVPGVWVRMMKDSIYSVCQNFSINRVLSDYLRDVYMPAKKGLTEISRDNYKPLQQAVKEEKIVLKYWDSIRFVSFTTNIDEKERMMEGEQIEIECGVAFGQAQPELFSLELFYMSDSQKAFKIVAMKLTGIRNDVVGYKHTLEIQGYGPQSFNVRLKPANLILQDIHPELVRWFE